MLANRLSAYADFEILLLEAGRTYASERFPKALADADNLGGGTEFDWGYIGKTTGPDCTIAAQSGKVLGGGSAINAAVAKRARATDFARWKAHGLGGWDFDQVQRIDDFNGPTQDGVGIDPFNVVHGIRQNTGMAYLTNAVRQRPNLTIRGETQMDRLDLTGRKVTGVHLVDGQLVKTDAVILCAGVYGSPAILMRSGIGPARSLDQLGIPLVVDLPVGQRLFDHPFYYNTYALKPQAGSMHPARGATIWTKSAEASGGELDLQITASNRSDPESPTGRTLTLATAVMTPVSVGNVRLGSRETRDAPIIDYNLLAAPQDRRRLLDGVKLARRIARSWPLVDLIDHEIQPGDVIRDDALEPVLEADLDTYHHGSGTVPMGGDADPGAAVDPEGRVRHVEGLRVVDASIFPEIPSTPTNLTVIMLAERMAKAMLGATT